MTDCGDIISKLSIAISSMELAKLDILPVLNDMYPRMVEPELRTKWITQLISAKLCLDDAVRNVNEVYGKLKEAGVPVR